MKSLKLYFALALLLCLAPMPYGYYMLVRIVATIWFIILARQYYVAKKEELVITFGVLALLFQPLVKISLGKEAWNIVDVAVAVLLLILWLKERNI